MIEFIQNTFPQLHLEPQLEEELRNRSIVLEVEEGHTLLHPKQSLENVYYIKEGVIRSSFKRTKGEFTNWLYASGDIMLAQESFYQENPSGFFWQASSESQIIEIKKKTSFTSQQTIQISLN